MMCEVDRWSSSRRATSNPVRPGIWMSRNTTSGWSRSIVVSASTPLPAWAMTSTPPTWPSRYANSSRASCSSSTRTARTSILCTMRDAQAQWPLGRDPFWDGQLGNLDARARPVARDALELELIVGAVNGPQALVDVAQPDPTAQRAFQSFFGHPEAVVFDFDDRVAVAEDASDRNASLADLARESVLD